VMRAWSQSVYVSGHTGRLLLIVLVVAISTPATAGRTPMCDGLPATDGGAGEDDDVIALLAGDDQINGFEGDDVICGKRGSDDPKDGGATTVSLVGPGSDLVLAWGGDDLLDGGGDDVLGTPDLAVGDQRGHDRYVADRGTTISTLSMPRRQRGLSAVVASTTSRLRTPDPGRRSSGADEAPIPASWTLTPTSSPGARGSIRGREERSLLRV
jgi:hypothetical protein